MLVDQGATKLRVAPQPTDMSTLAGSDRGYGPIGFKNERHDAGVGAAPTIPLRGRATSADVIIDMHREARKTNQDSLVPVVTMMTVKHPYPS